MMRNEADGGYRTQRYWEQYQPLLPPRLRLAEATAPHEAWWHWNGAEIHLDRSPLPEAPAVVVLLHGAGGYGRMLAPYGRLLRDAGYEVVAPDLPGYGLTRAPRALFDYGQWVRCVRALAEEEAAGGRPVVLFGASIGGYLAYLAAAAGAPAAGVIATTLADPRERRVRDEFARNRLFSRVGIPLLPLYDAIAGRLRLPIKWFSKMDRIANDPALAALIGADPLGGGNRVPVSFMRSLFAVVPAVEPEQFERCPLLLVHPAEDRWTSVAASRLLFDRLACPKQLVLLEHCGHFPLEEPGVSQLEQAVLAFLKTLHAPRPTAVA
jgi:alpha-beta hydrolase superfamily lysophospholipase